MSGMTRLVQYRGIVRPQSPLGQAVMRSVCYTDMTNGIQHRRAPPLQSLVVPTQEAEFWKSSGLDIDFRLFAKGFAMGELLEQLDQLINSTSKNGGMISQLLGKCLQLDMELQGWYQEDLFAQSPSSIYWTAAQDIGGQPGLSFANLHLAHLMLDFWALRLILGNIAVPL